MKKNIKNIVIIVVVLAVVAVGYYLFFGTTKNISPNSNSSLQTSTGTVPVNDIINPTPASTADASQISQEFVSQLLNLKAIKLNDDIFSSLAFRALQDFSIILVQPGNEGRANPFAPFDTDTTATNASSTTMEIQDGGMNVTAVDSVPNTSSDSTVSGSNGD